MRQIGSGLCVYRPNWRIVTTIIEQLTKGVYMTSALKNQTVNYAD